MIEGTSAIAASAIASTFVILYYKYHIVVQTMLITRDKGRCHW